MTQKQILTLARYLLYFDFPNCQPFFETTLKLVAMQMLITKASFNLMNLKKSQTQAYLHWELELLSILYLEPKVLLLLFFLLLFFLLLS